MGIEFGKAFPLKESLDKVLYVILDDVPTRIEKSSSAAIMSSNCRCTHDENNRFGLLKVRHDSKEIFIRANNTRCTHIENTRFNLL